MSAKPGGAHRCAFDFTYELVVLNKMMAARLRGETPPPTGDGEHYLVAPPEFCTIETASKQIGESVEDVISAVDALDEAGLSEEIELWGQQWTKMKLATLCGFHMGYHDGQLNYIQTAGGDLAVHWGG